MNRCQTATEKRRLRLCSIDFRADFAQFRAFSPNTFGLFEENFRSFSALFHNFAHFRSIPIIFFCFLQNSSSSPSLFNSPSPSPFLSLSLSHQLTVALSLSLSLPFKSFIYHFRALTLAPKQVLFHAFYSSSEASDSHSHRKNHRINRLIRHFSVPTEHRSRKKKRPT